MAESWRQQSNSEEFKFLEGLSEPDSSEWIPWQYPEDDQFKIDEINDKFSRSEVTLNPPDHPEIEDTTIIWEYEGKWRAIDRYLEERSENGLVRGQVHYAQTPFLENMADEMTFGLSHRFSRQANSFSSNYTRLYAGSGFERQLVAAYFDDEGAVRSIGLTLDSTGVVTRKHNLVSEKLQKFKNPQNTSEQNQKIGDEILEDLREYGEQRSVNYLQLFFTNDGVKVMKYTDKCMRLETELTMDEDEEGDYYGYYEPDEDTTRDPSAIEAEVDKMKALKGNRYNAGQFEVIVNRKGDNLVLGVYNKATESLDLALTLPTAIDINGLGRQLSGRDNIAGPEIGRYLPIYIQYPQLGRELRLAA